ncbi:MAG: LacI family transcriptional regulator [Clostridia bacterium]|nr:LacI family transcriptional regulator [Clostridia bacterium]
MSNKRIAELAHVSPATVSKVFSGSEEISADTVAHVLRIAEENGLLPPRFKKTNLAKKMPRIAILVPEIVSVYYARIVSEAVEILDEAGVYSEIHIAGLADESNRRVLHVLQEDGLTDGVLLVGITADFPEIHLPCVRLSESGQIQSKNGGFFIGIDDIAYMKHCLGYLTALGHRRIGFVGENNTQTKRIAFLRAAEQMHIPVSDEDICISGCRFEAIGKEAAHYYLEKRKKAPSAGMPSAFICAYDEVALGMISSFLAEGVRVPEDVSVIGINNIPAAAYSIPALTTIDSFSRTQVSLCIHLLREKIAMQEFDMPERIIIEGKLIERGSAGPGPAAGENE